MIIWKCLQNSLTQHACEQSCSSLTLVSLSERPLKPCRLPSTGDLEFDTPVTLLAHFPEFGLLLIHLISLLEKRRDCPKELDCYQIMRSEDHCLASIAEGLKSRSLARSIVLQIQHSEVNSNPDPVLSHHWRSDSEGEIRQHCSIAMIGQRHSGCQTENHLDYWVVGKKS